MTTEHNYDAGRHSKTYQPLAISNSAEFFPTYPDECLPFRAAEMAKTTIVQKVRYINARFNDLIAVWEKFLEKEASVDPSDPLSVQHRFIDGPNYRFLAGHPADTYEYAFTAESIVFSMKQVIDYLVQLTSILVDSAYVRSNQTIRCDSIGKVLSPDTRCDGVAQIVLGDASSYGADSTGFLVTINDLGNSFKHCFAHTVSRELFGFDVPTIVSYYVKSNKYSSSARMYLNHNAYHIAMGFHDTVLRILRNQRTWADLHSGQAST